MDRKIVFRAFVAAGELDLNRMAERCGIPKKYTWEEALIFNGERLAEMVGHSCTEDESVFVFSFGSVVTVNLTLDDDQKILSYLKELDSRVTQQDMKLYFDKYELRIGGDELELTDKYVSAPSYHVFQAELIATVLAKSVALEKIEEHQADIMDKVEPLIVRLERGKLSMSDKKIARAMSNIARCEYNSIAYIMILDKPDITWINTEAAEFYDALSDFFELSDRYEILRQKNEILSSVVEGISTTSHTIKSVFIEVSVLILIAVEVVIMLIDLFR